MRKNVITRSTGWGSLSYRKNGNFSGTAIIMIHGAVGDSRLFRYQLKYFGARYKTIALDLPGHGNSSSAATPGLDDFINAIRELLEYEEISSCVLIGHSMGGCVCLEACLRGLPGLAGMVLVSTSPVLPVSRELVGVMERDDMDSLAELIVGTVFSKRVDLLVGFAKSGLYGKNRDIIKSDIEICKKMDYSRSLAGIGIPVLVIANRFDRVVSCDLTAPLHDGIRGSKFVVFEEGGHVPFFENPQSFNAAVDAFIADFHLAQRQDATLYA
jgi:pimeloyl-ACP methyl ester carboxylesterase